MNTMLGNRNKTRRRLCCVPYCDSKNTSKKVSFHSFTKSEYLQKIWIERITRGILNNDKDNPYPFIFTKWTKICSQHFSKQDFKIGSERNRLKPSAIPTKFPWTKESPIIDAPKEEQVIRKTQNEIFNNAGYENACSETDSGSFIGISSANQNDCASPSSDPTEPSNEDMDVISQVKKEIPDRDMVSLPAELIIDHTYFASPVQIMDEDEMKETVSEGLVNVNMNIEEVNFVNPISEDRTSASTASDSREFDFRKMYFDLLIEFNDYKAEAERKAEQKKTVQTAKENLAALEIAKMKSNIDAPQPPQQTTQKPLFSIERFMRDDESIEYYTGFKDYKMFKISLKLLVGKDGDGMMPTSGRQCVQIIQNEIKELSVENQYFLVMMKLTHNFDTYHLGNIFKVSKAAADYLFNFWLDHMHAKLGRLSIWPNRAVLLSNSDKEFRRKYPTILGSLVVVELYGFKGLIVTDANGGIIFVSSLLKSSPSHQNLLVTSGFVKCLKMQMKKKWLLHDDILLAGKCCRVKNLLAPRKLDIDIPVFRMRGGFPSSFQEDHGHETTSVVDQETIHFSWVETMIDRIKSFKILTETEPDLMLSDGLFDKIWTVCCLLCKFADLEISLSRNENQE